jgi:hypothetical protein
MISLTNAQEKFGVAGTSRSASDYARCAAERVADGAARRPYRKRWRRNHAP